MLIVVRLVIQMEKIIIKIGSVVNSIQPVLDNPSIAIKPMRALCAVESISSIIGRAHKYPMLHAVRQIFPTIICICRAIKLSDAPT